MPKPIENNDNAKDFWGHLGNSSALTAATKELLRDLIGAVPVVQSADFTAENGETYHVTANATVTDPSLPVEGKGFTVVVIAGTATVGGTTYPTGAVIMRTYTALSWLTHTVILQPDSISDKTTPVDDDRLLLTDSADAHTPKRLPVGNLWTWITAKLGALTSLTAGGAWNFSSTTRPTSAGTGTPAATSLITTADGDARFYRSIAVYKNADTIRTANTYTLDPNLQVPVESGAVYEFWIYVQCAAAATAAINNSSCIISGPNCFWSRMFYERHNFYTAVIPTLTPLSSGQVFNVLSATTGVLRLHGTFKTSAAGTFGVVWGNTGTAGANATLDAGSYMKITRIG